VAVDACRRITSIAAKPTSDGFVTGGLDGELDSWSWQRRSCQERLRGATNERTAHFPGIAWATYNPNSIVGICFLCDRQRWVTVSAGGKVGLWKGGALVRSWDLPQGGSPRSLAAHPTEPWIAVGVKNGGFARPESVVVVAEVDL